VGSPVQVAEMLNEAGDVRRIVLLMEQTEPGKEKVTLPKGKHLLVHAFHLFLGVLCCSANELYVNYCRSIKFDPTSGHLPSIAETFQMG
jgi:hypothetical protein